MKLLLPTLALLLFALGCKKYEAEYAVFCRFADHISSANNKILFVTDSAGKILHHFDLEKTGNVFNVKFSLEGKDLPEIFDLHLFVYPGNFDKALKLYSHLDVFNGASVYFGSSIYAGKGLDDFYLQVEDIASFDSIRIIGDPLEFKPDFQASQKVVSIRTFREPGYGIVIRLQANNAPEFRHLYIPGDMVTDTLKVSWSDFTPENNIQNIELSGVDQPSELKVTAVSPDFKNFVHLEDRRYQGQPILPYFNSPDSLAAPVAYRVFINNQESAFERIFQPDEPMRFEPSDMSITQFELSGRNLRVASQGNVDMLRVQSYTSVPIVTDYNAVFWTVEGAPESFQHRTLPELSGYLPSDYYSGSNLKIHQAIALQFDNHDYLQIREGFPYRLNEPFAVARSGYRAVWKYFF